MLKLIMTKTQTLNEVNNRKGSGKGEYEMKFKMRIKIIRLESVRKQPTLYIIASAMINEYGEYCCLIDGRKVRIIN